MCESVCLCVCVYIHCFAPNGCGEREGIKETINPCFRVGLPRLQTIIFVCIWYITCDQIVQQVDNRSAVPI